MGPPLSESSRPGNSVGGSRPVDQQPVVPEPSDHVEVDHGVGPGEREHRVLHVVVRAEQAGFLTAEGDEDHGPGRRSLPQLPGDVNQRAAAGGVVVRAVVDLAGAVGVERPELPRPR